MKPFLMGCLPFLMGCLTFASPLPAGDTLNDREAAQLEQLARLVASCSPVQGFPWVPCPLGITDTTVPGLVVILRIKRVDGTFPCASFDEAVGCYNHAYRTITVDVSGKLYDPEGTLDHEFLHALLWSIDDPRKHCSLHDFNDNELWDCYE